MTEVWLEPVLVIEEENERQRALRVLSKTESSCLITNSIKAKVIMSPIVRVDPVKEKA